MDNDAGRRDLINGGRSNGDGGGPSEVDIGDLVSSSLRPRVQRSASSFGKENGKEALELTRQVEVS